MFPSFSDEGKERVYEFNSLKWFNNELHPSSTTGTYNYLTFEVN